LNSKQDLRTGLVKVNSKDCPVRYGNARLISNLKFPVSTSFWSLISGIRGIRPS